MASIKSTSSVLISKPSSGETLRVASTPGGVIGFGFDPATSSILRSANDLVLEVGDGGSVRLTNFFVVGDQPLPSLALPGGTNVAAAEYLARFGIDLNPAAETRGSGVGEYVDDAGTLINGIAHLGLLAGADGWSEADIDSVILSGETGIGKAPSEPVSNFIYDTAGNTAMTGGPGPDIFVWNADHLGDNTTIDTVTNFTLGEDLLRFDGFFGAGASEPSMNDILAKLGSSGLDITVTDANHVTLTVGAQSIDVSILGQGLENYQSSTALADKAALLMQLLSSSGG